MYLYYTHLLQLILDIWFRTIKTHPHFFEIVQFLFLWRYYVLTWSFYNKMSFFTATTGGTARGYLIRFFIYASVWCCNFCTKAFGKTWSNLRNEAKRKNTTPFFNCLFPSYQFSHFCRSKSFTFQVRSKNFPRNYYFPPEALFYYCKKFEFELI